MEEKTIEILKHWRDNWGFINPTQYLGEKREKFIDDCRNAWAANEVIEELANHPNENPIDVIEDFRDRMDNYISIAQTDLAKDLFITLYEISTMFLDDMLFFMGRR